MTARGPGAAGGGSRGAPGAPPSHPRVPGVPLCHRRVPAAGVELHLAEAGAGPPVLLLHGFPEFWYAWAPQIRALAAGGFRTLVPDLRGYGTSGKPAGVASYRLSALTEDVRALIRAEAGGRAHLVGHDWGGVLAWHVAARWPQRVDRLVVLNAPHPDAYRRALVRDPRQLAKAWYVFFFQLPWLPEAAIRAFDYGILRRLLRNDPARPDAFGEEEIARYVEALARPGALTAALNWYRAAGRAMARRALASSGAGRRSGADSGAGSRGRGEEPGRQTEEGSPARPRLVVRVPTLVLWGERDRYLETSLLAGLSRWVPDLRIERLPEASHWIQRDAAERVNRCLLEFLGG